MNKMSRAVFVFMILCQSMMLCVGAANVHSNEPDEIPSDAVVVREDVSFADACLSEGFSLNAALAQANTPEPRSTYWNAWGVKKRDPDGFGSTYIPVGYSEHINAGAVLSTYHYTRTYLDDAFHLLKSCDSGRCWGYYTVKAEGTPGLYDVWDSSVHMVKYGTAD